MGSFLFQIALEFDRSALRVGGFDLFPIFAWIFAGIGLLFVGHIFLRIIKSFSHYIFKTPEKYHKVILKVQVPKITNSAEHKSGEKNLQQIQEEIGVTETLFGSICGLNPEGGLKGWFFGRHDDVAFEVIFDEAKISFFVATPIYLQGYIEQQIHAQYPEAHIEPVPDYNIFRPDSVVVGSYLIFKRPYVYPIKTYKQLQSDPLNAILNTFNKFEEYEGAALQFLIRPAKKSWHGWGVRAVANMHKGMSMSEAVRASTPSILGRFFYEVKSLFKGKKKDDLGKDDFHKLSGKEEEAAKCIEEKSSKGGVDVNIRIIVSSRNKAKAELRLNDINNAFSQFNIYEYGNSFSAHTGGRLSTLVHAFIHRTFNDSRNVILNTEEMASLYHFPLLSTEVPNIEWLSAKRASCPINISKDGLSLGENIYRSKKTEIKIKIEDRRRHMYVIGMTGTGKSVFIEGLALQDIINGDGVCFIDPHGDAIDALLAHMPKERAEDVILFDPANVERPLGLNMLEYENDQQKLFVIDTILQIFDKLYDLKATGGPMFEQYMRNSLMLAMDDPETGMTLADIPKVLADEEYRRMKLSRCKTPVVKDFWEKEAQKAGGEASLQNMVPYITSKLTPFLANDLIRPIISQQHSSFHFREAMDAKKIILVKLSKGKIGDLNANLLGMIMINKILMAALGRSDVDENQRTDFYLYVDEFQNFLTDSIEIILAEARKYRLSLIIAHQYLGQLVKHSETKFRDAIFGNVGTKIAFRIGVDDAEQLTKEFAPTFSEYDFLNVPKYNCFVKLLIDNANPTPFNMGTHPMTHFADENKERGVLIAQLALLKYGRDKALIEKQLQKRDLLIRELIQNQRPAMPTSSKPGMF